MINDIIIAFQNTLSIDRSPVAAYLTRLQSEQSRRVMRTALRNIITYFLDIAPQDLEKGQEFFFEWWKLDYPHINLIYTRLQSSLSPASVNKHLSALRGVLKECWRLKLMTAEQLAQSTDFKGLKSNRLPTGRHVSIKEIKKMIDDCSDGGLKGIRDQAIIMTLYLTGIRRMELIGLTLPDVDMHDRAIKIRGKGHTERLVPIHPALAETLQEWVDIRGELDTQALFVSITKGGEYGAPLRVNDVWKMINVRAARCGLRKMTPHDLRRSFVTNLLERGADSTIIMKITGHKSPEMVERYDRRPEAAKANAVKMIEW